MVYASHVIDSMPDGFCCEVRCRSGRAIVRPVGELDMATVEPVDGALRELRSLGFRDLLLDLRGLTFMDSSGIALLVRWHAAASQDGIVLGIVLGGDPVRQPLELTGILDHLPLVDAPDE